MKQFLEDLKIGESSLKRSFRLSQYNMGKNITGNDMANFLDKYAEIGFEYVTKVKNMIEKNKLSKYENSVLTTY